MGTPRFTPEFKEEAVRQITERGYSIAEVYDRLVDEAHYLMRTRADGCVASKTGWRGYRTYRSGQQIWQRRLAALLPG